MTIIKRAICSILFRATRPYKRIIEKYSLVGKNPSEVFTEVYKNNYWGDRDSVSGPGSNLKQTDVLRHELSILFKKKCYSKILDVPCGDFFWMKEMDLSSYQYLGGDIVSDLIISNTEKYKKDNVNFILCNLIDDELPDADLLIMRDCLVHLSFADISNVIANVVNSDIKYLLTTTFLNVNKNKDIVTGQWRMINLELEPFNFPKADEYIIECCRESNSAIGKSLGLWSIEKLRQHRSCTQLIKEAT